MKCKHLITILGIGLLTYACGGDDGDSDNDTAANDDSGDNSSGDDGDDADAEDSDDSTSGSSSGDDADDADGDDADADDLDGDDSGSDDGGNADDADADSDSDDADGDEADADEDDADSDTGDEDSGDETDEDSADDEPVMTDAIAATMCEEDMGTADETPECEAYTECAVDNCEGAYQACLGDGFESGDFSGAPCEELLTCSEEAEDPCNTDCTPSNECTNCLLDEVFGCIVDECADEYEECTGVDPSILTDLTGGGDLTSEATCDDLADCCGDLDAALQDACEMTVDQGLDLSCGVTYDLLCGG